MKHKDTQPLYIFNRENLQNSEPKNGPRSGLDYIALPLCTAGRKIKLKIEKKPTFFLENFGRKHKMERTKKQIFEKSYLSNAYSNILPIECETLDYGQFLELCVTNQPSGLGLHFKVV